MEEMCRWCVTKKPARDTLWHRGRVDIRRGMVSSSVGHGDLFADDPLVDLLAMD
jgi:hypothetical protein